jgi:hypothetical protein
LEGYVDDSARDGSASDQLEIEFAAGRLFEPGGVLVFVFFGQAGEDFLIRAMLRSF